MEKRDLNKIIVQCSTLDNQIKDLTLDEIKKYLDYEEDFWTFIEPRIRRIKYMGVEFIDFFGVFMNDDNEKIDKFIISLPEITNLFTALINIHEYTHAYDLYKTLGSIYEKTEIYEKNAINKEENFKVYCLKYLKK